MKTQKVNMKKISKRKKTKPVMFVTVVPQSLICSSMSNEELSKLGVTTILKD